MKIVRPITITDDILISSSIPADDYGEYDVAVTYGDGDRVISGTLIYESVQAGNVGVVLTNTAWWLEVGQINRWRMFDQTNTSQSEAMSEIAVELLPAQRFDSVVVLNARAAQMQVTITDPVDGTVYDATTSMIATSGVDDWYKYFFEEIKYKSDAAIVELPIYSNATVAVTLSNPGETVLCGTLIIGQSLEIGYTQYGANVGIQDYSIKQADAWGNYEILQRAFAKRGEFTVWVEAGRVDQLQALLASYRATPVVYIGSTDYASTIICGWYRDFAIDITYPSVSVCTLYVEGLT